ncbi:putative Squamosa promoter-binding protein-like transcription factor family protein [Hibiscus syriacus]|uniref:Squamosa promoter-binding protein-like transcription factor family protein n=1 Tax=Hibiscus syriacus TaxID=106335 RepID=A0A6A3ARL7_HIBSY|nr:putative Squamosa promoter-binding protein-like transcription factor family protein [Hibiscus syriacus]
MSKKSFRCRDGSGELDVFEAAKYFSGYSEATSYNGATLINEKITRDERQPPKGGRISLDVPMRRNPLLQHSHSFQKEENSKSCTTQSMKGEEESPGGGRRKRRMSISHFRSVATKSFYSSSSSGFRTPPPYAAATPTKNYKSSDLLNEKRNEKSKFIDEILEKYKNLDTRHRDMNNRNVRVDRYEPEEKGFGRKFCEMDDGEDSDSSSDLFELKSFDLGSYSSGLPVFETTNMDSFKRGAPVSNGAL